MNSKVPKWLPDLEIRFCSIFTLISFILCCVSLTVFLEPLLETLFAKYYSVTCIVKDIRTLYGLQCDWSSCWKSCTNPDTECTQIEALFAHKNDSKFSVLPLKASIHSCGFEVDCKKFFDTFKINSTFDCYLVDGKDVLIPKITIPKHSIKYLYLSLIPFLGLMIGIIYTVTQKIFERGKKKKECKKVKKVDGPTSFYQKKMMELDKLKKAREERERIARYCDNVRVEELETVTALVFKPSSSWMIPMVDP